MPQPSATSTKSSFTSKNQNNMTEFIQGWSVECPKCHTLNEIFKEDMKYPARVPEVIYCANCNEILGHKNSTSSLDTRIAEDEIKSN